MKTFLIIALHVLIGAILVIYSLLEQFHFTIPIALIWLIVSVAVHLRSPWKNPILLTIHFAICILWFIYMRDYRGEYELSIVFLPITYFIAGMVAYPKSYILIALKVALPVIVGILMMIESQNCGVGDCAFAFGIAILAFAIAIAYAIVLFIIAAIARRTVKTQY